MEGSSCCRFQLIKSETALINKSCREKSLEREREREGLREKHSMRRLRVFNPRDRVPFSALLKPWTRGGGSGKDRSAAAFMTATPFVYYPRLPFCRTI